MVRGVGSLSLVRKPVPDGPWRWQLLIRDADGADVAGVDLTKDDLPKLRDFFSKAVVVEQGGGGAG